MNSFGKIMICDDVTWLLQRLLICWLKVRRPRLPFAEQAESFAIPPDQRGRLHDREHGPPVDHLGKQDERNPRRIIGPRARCKLRLQAKLSFDRCISTRRPDRELKLQPSA